MNMPKNHKKYWTLNEERELKSLIVKKKSHYEIAVIMARTETAIISKIRSIRK
jgi:hypothetical protein